MQIQSNGILTKVQTATVAGAISSILIWLLTSYGGMEIPEPIVAAITTLIMALVAYVTPLLPTDLKVVKTPDPAVFGNGGKVIAPVVSDDQS